LDTGKKKKNFTDMLLEAYDGNQDAVDAGAYFVDIYNQWDELSKELDEEYRSKLDRMICQLLNGESPKIVSTLNDVGSHFIDKGAKVSKDYLNLVMSIMGAEIITNPFVLANREKLMAVTIDAINETARRHLNKELSDAADIGRWQILSAIAMLTSGADEGLRVSLSLRGASHG